MTLSVRTKRKGRVYLDHVSQEVISVDSDNTLNLGCFRGHGHLSITPEAGTEVKYQTTGIVPGFNEFGGIDAIVTIRERPNKSWVDFVFKAHNLVPHLQPPLTLDEILSGNSRPDHVVNSIAWYHSTKRHLVTHEDVANRITTGKALGQYRMKAVDAEGNWCWAGWSLPGGPRARLQLDSSFLNRAVYPVVISPLGDTFGYTTVGGTTQSFGTANKISGFYAWSPAGNGTMSSLSMYNYTGSGSYNQQFAVYTDGATSSRVDYTGTGSIPNSAAWTTLSATVGASIASGTNYDFCTNNTAGSFVWYYDSNTSYNNEWNDVTTTFGTWPTSVTWTNRPYVTHQEVSFYGTYTPTPVAPTAVTEDPTSVGQTSAVIPGQVSNTGGDTVTSWGVEYGPTISYGSQTTHTGSQSSPFSWSDTLSSLSSGTMYHYRTWATSAVGTGYGSDGIFYTSSAAGLEQILMAAPGNGTPSTSAVNYTAPIMSGGGWFATATGSYMLSPMDGTITKFFVRLGGAPGTGGSLTLSLLNVTQSTSISVTLSGSELTAINNGTLAVNAGDLLVMESSPSGSPLGGTNPLWCFSFFSNSAVQSGLFCQFTGPANSPVFIGGTTTGTAADVRQVVPIAGTIKNLYVWLGVAPGSGNSITVTLYKNGAATGLSVTISGTATTGNNTSATTYVSVAQGDYLYYVISSTGSPSTASSGASAQFLSSVPGQSLLMAIGNFSGGPYESIFDVFNAPWTLESDVVSYLNRTVKISHLTVLLVSAPGSGLTNTYTVRANYASTLLSVPLTGSAVAGQDNSHVAIISNGSPINLMAVEGTAGIQLAISSTIGPASPLSGGDMAAKLEAAGLL